MILVGTEDDGLVHPACLLQVGSNLVCHLTDAVFDDDIVVVIGIIVDAVFDDIPVNITLSFSWSPTITDIGLDVDDFVWSQKTILNSLF